MKKVISLFLTLVMVVGIVSGMPVNVSATNSMVENAINWAIGIANDNNYGYSQVNRYGNPDYDCSSLVSTAFHNAGFNVACELNTYTMKDAFVNAGFTWIPASQISGFPSSCANLQRGDILLATSHTELYIGNGKNVGAHMDYNGIPGGIGGGKTWSNGYNAYRYGADEIDVCNYWNDNWLGVLRYGDTYKEPPVAPIVYLSRTILKTNEIATLYWDSCDKAEYYWISCWSATEQCISEESHSLSKEISFSSPGKYSITVVSGNSKGETIGNWIDIEVYDTNGYNKIAYNANGGTGTMSSHNVYYNSIFSLKKSTFKKIGYKQIGWNAYRNSDNKWFAYGIGWKTEEDIKKNNWSKSVYPNPLENWTFDWSWYNEGIVNDTITFYAVWEKVDTYTITYNANGGTGAPSSQTKTYGQTLTLSSTKPTRSGYTFLGWSTSSTATKATYSAGGSFTTDANTTLYAVWQKNHSHSYTGTVTKAPTCTQTGIKTYKCSCGASYTQTISATGHTAVKDSAVAATCTKAGKTEGSHCSVCNSVIKAQTIISSKGHKSDSWWIKKATVYEDGEKFKVCTECGEIFETVIIKQLTCSKPKLSKIENTSSGVKITWGKVSGADKYVVYRKTGSSGKYSKIGTTSKTYYTDKKASSGKKYYYYVKAVNEAGSSDASSSKSIYYLADTTLSTPKSTKSGVTLKWKKVTGADGYQVYRKTGSGSYSKIATVKGNSKVTYTDKKAKKGKTYTYKIKAYKSKTTSAYSNAKKIKDKY